MKGWSITEQESIKIRIKKQKDLIEAAKNEIKRLKSKLTKPTHLKEKMYEKSI